MAKWDVKAATVAGLGVALAMVAPQTEAVAQADQQEPPWIKVCQTDTNTNKELCMVNKDIVAPTGQFIASASLRQITGEPAISLVVATPPGMLLEPGMRAQIDGGQQYEVTYDICFPNLCFGDLAVNAEFINAMKAGGQLTISALNQGQQVIAVPLSLIGFTKVYDGEGLDPAGGAEVQNELRKALQERAAEAAERLRQQQSNN